MNVANAAADIPHTTVPGAPAAGNGVPPVSTAPTPNGDSYEGGNVDILKDAAHIRARPGMYIGDNSTKGLHHLVYELVYNSVDEALAGHCKQIDVVVDHDGSISVADDGRGIPVEIHPQVGRSTLEVVLTTVGAGAKFDNRAYKTSAGLHGIGAKAVTALSEWTEAEVRRNGKVYRQEYERGYATTEVKELGNTPGHVTGTKISFMPDPEIFGATTFEYDILEHRLRELAYLNKGLAIHLLDQRNGKEDRFFAEGGVAEYVEYLNRSEETVHKTLYIDRTVDEVRVEVAFQYTTGEDERVRCYANNAHNPNGGTHLSGFRTAITRSLSTYGKKMNLFKNVEPIGEDYREGITAVVSVALQDPQFESQTKIKLNNPEVDGIVSGVVYEFLTTYLEENPKEANKVMKKVILAAEAREAATKAKKALKDRKNILSGGGLPGKLMDCTTRDRDESELFLVEGGSAGGSADNGRDRHYQAILPLRGKVLNVEKARMEKVLANEELCSLISAIGVDIGNSEEIEKLRYGKIIILTDADVDGQHIRTLLLTFFYRQMKKLIEEGRIYVARPPLFKVEQKKSTRYVQTMGEMSKELMERGLEGAKLRIQRPDKKEPVELAGEKLKNLVAVLEEMEDSLVILERRGYNIAKLIERMKDGKLPTFRVVLGTEEKWMFSREEVDAFREAELKKGRELVIVDGAHPTPTQSNGNGHAAAEIFSSQELHDARAVNRGLEKLKPFGVDAHDLIPAPRIAGREPAQRFFRQTDAKTQHLVHLRLLVADIRKLGENGIKIVRFKGLGEMDGEELWDTTLDPARRTLLKVELDDALIADEMFRVLMGEKVEPRREFIQKHALEVKDIDYHGGCVHPRRRALGVSPGSMPRRRPGDSLKLVPRLDHASTISFASMNSDRIAIAKKTPPHSQNADVQAQVFAARTRSGGDANAPRLPHMFDQPRTKPTFFSPMSRLRAQSAGQRQIAEERDEPAQDHQSPCLRLGHDRNRQPLQREAHRPVEPASQRRHERRVAGDGEAAVQVGGRPTHHGDVRHHEVEPGRHEARQGHRQRSAPTIAESVHRHVGEPAAEDHRGEGDQSDQRAHGAAGREVGPVHLEQILVEEREQEHPAEVAADLDDRRQPQRPVPEHGRPDSAAGRRR